MASPRKLYHSANEFDDPSAALTKTEGGLFRHTVHRVRYKADGATFYQKENSNDISRAIDNCGGEFFHLLIPHQPRVLQSRNQNGVACINSEAMPGDRSFENEFKNNSNTLKLQLETGALRGLGSIFAVGYFLNETDWKSGNLRIATILGQDYVVKIDNDWCFSSLQRDQMIGDGTRTDRITVKGVARLILMDDYMDHNRLDRVAQGEDRDAYLPNSNQFRLIDEQLLIRPHYCYEVNRAFLRILMMPPAMMRSMAERSTEAKPMQDKLSAELDSRQCQLFNALLQTPAFKAYLETDEAKQAAEEAQKDYQAYCKLNKITMNQDLPNLEERLGLIRTGPSERLQLYLNNAADLDEQLIAAAPNKPLDHLRLLEMKKQELKMALMAARWLVNKTDENILLMLQTGLDLEIKKGYQRALRAIEHHALVNDKGALTSKEVNDLAIAFEALKPYAETSGHQADMAVMSFKLGILQQNLTDLERETKLSRMMPNPQHNVSQRIDQIISHYNGLNVLVNELNKLPGKQLDITQCVQVQRKILIPQALQLFPDFLNEMEVGRNNMIQAKNLEGLKAQIVLMESVITWYNAQAIPCTAYEDMLNTLKQTQSDLEVDIELQALKVQLEVTNKKIAGVDKDLNRLELTAIRLEMLPLYEKLYALAKSTNSKNEIVSLNNEIMKINKDITLDFNIALGAHLKRVSEGEGESKLKEFSRQARFVSVLDQAINLSQGDEAWVDRDYLHEVYNDALDSMNSTIEALLQPFSERLADAKDENNHRERYNIIKDKLEVMVAMQLKALPLRQEFLSALTIEAEMDALLLGFKNKPDLEEMKVQVALMNTLLGHVQAFTPEGSLFSVLRQLQVGAWTLELQLSEIELAAGDENSQDPELILNNILDASKQVHIAVQLRQSHGDDNTNLLLVQKEQQLANYRDQYLESYHDAYESAKDKDPMEALKQACLLLRAYEKVEIYVELPEGYSGPHQQWLSGEAKFIRQEIEKFVPAILNNFEAELKAVHREDKSDRALLSTLSTRLEVLKKIEENMTDLSLPDLKKKITKDIHLTGQQLDKIRREHGEKIQMALEKLKDAQSRDDATAEKGRKLN